jgi:hypothetical protein
MRRHDPRALEEFVRNAPISNSPSVLPNEFLCRAVDYASVFYFKKVWCRQRSAATTILLRRFGWDAKMVIGAQIFPFRSHAWVEVQGQIVNDKPYMREIYQVLDWC